MNPENSKWNKFVQKIGSYSVIVTNQKSYGASTMNDNLRHLFNDEPHHDKTDPRDEFLFQGALESAEETTSGEESFDASNSNTSVNNESVNDESTEEMFVGYLKEIVGDDSQEDNQLELFSDHDDNPLELFSDHDDNPLELFSDHDDNPLELINDSHEGNSLFEDNPLGLNESHEEFNIFSNDDLSDTASSD